MGMIPAADEGPCIVARGIEKSYQSGGVAEQVLRGVDLEVPSGSFAVLLGPSGCGKTTLLNMVGALDTPDRGELMVHGVALTARSKGELSAFRRRIIGFIFQSYNLMPTLTVRENLEIVLEPLGIQRVDRRRQARDILDRVGLSGHEHKFPGHLSGGEQQRVAIARALVKSPAIVLADEPTGNLDQDNGHQVIQLMRRLNQDSGVCFLVATHDRTIAREASMVLWMEDGLVRDSGVGGETTSA